MVALQKSKIVESQGKLLKEAGDTDMKESTADTGVMDTTKVKCLLEKLVNWSINASRMR